MAAGTLYLLPGLLGEENDPAVLCGWELRLVQEELTCFFSENEKTARRFLRKAGYTGSFDNIQLHRLDKNSTASDLFELLHILTGGTDAGILSEAGSPAIADPGASLVRLAHRHGISVVPVPGPSAIMLAIMGAGLNGQQFSFNGYLPIEKSERAKAIVRLEELSYKTGFAQFFIETPYRNTALFDELLQHCHPGTDICVAVNLTLPDGWIRTRSAAEWKRLRPDLHKKPAVYGVLRRP